MGHSKLEMSFEPNTIEHLGVKMYSHIPPAIAELIANAYDACATEVRIKFIDEGENKQIIVADNGTGMSFNEVNEYFLRIGRNRRKENQDSPCGRIPTGRKGLGKLALFGLGSIIMIETYKDGERVSFTLDYESILATTGKPYEPEFERDANPDKNHGTTILLNKLNKRTGFPIHDYASSLAKLFNFHDPAFKVWIQLNDEQEILIDNKLKYESVKTEFEWSYERLVTLFTEVDYEFKDSIRGKLLSSEKPLRPGLRGITLFANGRMANAPEFFGRSESSHFFSYLTGWLDVDFIDLQDDDLISTDRQSLNWDREKTTELREFLSNLIGRLESVWRAKRKEKRQNRIQEKTRVNISDWLGKVPDNIRPQIETIIQSMDNSELSTTEQTTVVKNLHNLVPEYPNLHWRHIHPEIQAVSRKYYESSDYYTAFIEGLKRYISEVKKKSGMSNIMDRNLMQAVFNGKLLVAANYRKSDGEAFDELTIQNIEDGHKMLSEGIVVGGRNPLQHEEHLELSLTGLFSEKDCLDFLSLLSHLFNRLDKAVNVS